MPLSDLARDTLSHSRRGFITLKRILFGEFHAFVMRPKLDDFARWKEMSFSFRKYAITASPSLDPDFCDPFNVGS